MGNYKDDHDFLVAKTIRDDVENITLFRNPSTGKFTYKYDDSYRYSYDQMIKVMLVDADHFWFAIPKKKDEPLVQRYAQLNDAIDEGLETAKMSKTPKLPADQQPDPGPERFDKQPYDQVAKLTVSGSNLRIGLDRDTMEPSIFLHTDEGYEAVFMTPNEAKLVIAALNVAISRAEGDF